MAEGVFRSLGETHPRIGQIDSCGTGAYHELDPPDYRTMQTLQKHGIVYDHAARKVTAQDFSDFDFMFAMDAWNLRDLQKMQRRLESKGQKTKAKVMLFGEFGGGGRGKTEEVVDRKWRRIGLVILWANMLTTASAYYGADNGFDTVFEQVQRFSTNFLRELEKGSLAASAS